MDQLPGTYDDGAGPYTLVWGIEREGANAERPASMETGRSSLEEPPELRRVRRQAADWLTGLALDESNPWTCAHRLASVRFVTLSFR